MLPNNIRDITNRVHRISNDLNKFNEIVDLQNWTIDTLRENKCIKRYKVVPCGVVIYRYEDLYLNDLRTQYREKAIMAADEHKKLTAKLVSDEEKEYISNREARLFSPKHGMLFSIGKEKYAYNTSRFEPKFEYLCPDNIIKNEFPVWIVLAKTSLENKMKETLQEWVEWCRLDPDVKELLIGDLEKVDDKFFMFNMKLVAQNREDFLTSFVLNFYFRLGGRKGLHFVAFACNEKEAKDYLEYISTI